jgi:hypothetical protein
MFIFRVLCDYYRFRVNFIEFSWVAGTAMLFNLLPNNYQKIIYLTVIININ